MHRASLRKSVLRPARPQYQRGNLVSQALLFCQSGKSGQVNNKALALRISNGHMNIEASPEVDAARTCVFSEKLDSQLQTSVLPKKKQSAKIIRLLISCVAMAIPC